RTQAHLPHVQRLHDRAAQRLAVGLLSARWSLQKLGSGCTTQADQASPSPELCGGVRGSGVNKRSVAFITGASRGIGRGIAIELARHGYDLAGNSRHFDSADQTSGLFEVKRRVEELGAVFLPLQGDDAALEDHERMIEKILEQFGQIDLLVNNAGVAPEQRSDILETTAASFDRV